VTYAHCVVRRALFLAALLLPATAGAAPIASDDAALAKLIDGYQRQHDVFATAELGVSLNPWIKAEALDTVRNFFAQDAQRDFQAFSGKHPFEVVDHFNEHEDLGNFGGIASVGYAARFIVLKKSGAPESELARARDAVVRAANAWIVYGSIGGPGVVARGIRRIKPLEAGAPAIPGTVPELVPLRDGSGNPLPTKKSPVYRAPVAKNMDGWIWVDDTSKDQVIGYALATVWLYDALRDDPMAPPGLADRLAAPLVAFARALMKVVPEKGIDMFARDADGRLTSFGDLNDRLITSAGDPLPEESTLRNGFNAAMGAAMVRAAFHVSGQQDIGEFYYQELVGKRDYPGSIAKNAGAIFTGTRTNFSNVNMLAIALAVLGRTETDPYAREKLATALQSQFWDVGSDRDVSHVKQAWFDTIYGAYGPKPPAEVRARVMEQLAGFQPAPAFQRDRTNCDAGELAARSCIAIDGTTMITIASTPGHNSGIVAKSILPMAIRPDSDMAWRSDPHSPNDGPANRINPGGDVLGAYWLARLSDLDDTQRNLSPHARAPLPYTRATPEEEDAGVGATPGGESSGCGCRVASAHGTPLVGLLAALLLLARAWHRH
jgi:hypothetical protein